MLSKDPHRYDDMLDMPHHTSKTRPPMTLMNRAAQFAPFAALTGYDSQVKEAARLTDSKTDLSENELSELDQQLQFLSLHLSERPLVEITHFLPDQKKEGGQYITATGIIKKIDHFQRCIVFFDKNGISDGLSIPLDLIADIDGEIFTMY